MAYKDLQELGDEKNVKAAGKMRLEGKSYIVEDGDIINFRFNI
jgi:ribosome-binding ATPase YchF (GTP1/OBG family)